MAVGNARSTQQVLEVLYLGANKARSTQQLLEVMYVESVGGGVIAYSNAMFVGIGISL